MTYVGAINYSSSRMGSIKKDSIDCKGYTKFGLSVTIFYAFEKFILLEVFLGPKLIILVSLIGILTLFVCFFIRSLAISSEGSDPVNITKNK